MQPLVWAYIGDSVYEMYIRMYVMQKLKQNPHKLHIAAIKYVSAKAQANILEDLQEFLTEEEKDIVRRGRNAKNHHVPKNTDVRIYMYSTAFEALIGYLYLTKQHKRLNELLEKCIQIRK